LYGIAAGMWIFHVLSFGPASRRSILEFGFAVRRFAKMHPADPAPTMTKSWVEENDEVDQK